MIYVTCLTYKISNNSNIWFQRIIQFAIKMLNQRGLHCLKVFCIDFKLNFSQAKNQNPDIPVFEFWNHVKVSVFDRYIFWTFQNQIELFVMKAYRWKWDPFEDSKWLSVRLNIPDRTSNIATIRKMTFPFVWLELGHLQDSCCVQKDLSSDNRQSFYQLSWKLNNWELSYICLFHISGHFRWHFSFSADNYWESIPTPSL